MLTDLSELNRDFGVLERLKKYMLYFSVSVTSSPSFWDSDMDLNQLSNTPHMLRETHRQGEICSGMAFVSY